MGSRESGKSTPFPGFHGNEVTAHRLIDPVVIGIVVAPHGVRGTLKVRAIGPGKHIRKNSTPVIGSARRKILAARQTPKGFLVEVEGVRSREEARTLQGVELLLERGELDAPEEGEYYVADLVGLTAVNEAGEILGVVEDTFETAAHEVLVVREEDDGDFYIPFTLEHVPELDARLGRITIRPPEE